MNNIDTYKEKTFEDIKHIDEIGNEYWKARELMLALEYSKWEHFAKVINKAKINYNVYTIISVKLCNLASLSEIIGSRIGLRQI